MFFYYLEYLFAFNTVSGDPTLCQEGKGNQ